MTYKEEPILVLSRRHRHLDSTAKQNEMAMKPQLRSPASNPLGDPSIVTFSTIIICVTILFVGKGKKNLNLTQKTVKLDFPLSSPESVGLDSLIGFIPSVETIAFYMSTLSVVVILWSLYFYASRVLTVFLWLSDLIHRFHNSTHNFTSRIINFHPLEETYKLIEQNDTRDKFLLLMGTLNKLAFDCGLYLTNTNNGSYSISPVGSIILNENQYNIILTKVLFVCDNQSVPNENKDTYFSFPGAFAATQIVDKKKLILMIEDFHLHVNKTHNDVITPPFLNFVNRTLDGNAISLKMGCVLIINPIVYLFERTLKNRIYNLFSTQLKYYIFSDNALGKFTIKALKRTFLSTFEKTMLKPHLKLILEFIPDSYSDITIFFISCVTSWYISRYIIDRIKSFVLLQIYNQHRKQRMSSMEAIRGAHMLSSAIQDSINKRGLGK
jgi:hypothetical protein